MSALDHITGADLRRKRVAGRTARQYGVAWRHWTRFMRRRGVAALGASGEDAAEWYALLLRDRATRWTMATYRSGVRYHHRLAGRACPLDEPEARQAWEGLLRIYPRIVRPSRALRVDELLALLAHCDSDPVVRRGVRDGALLATGFSAALRCREISGLDLGDVDYAGEGRRILRIRRSKTDQRGLGQSVPLLDGRRVHAVERLDHLIYLRGTRPGPLFQAMPPGVCIRRQQYSGARLGYEGIRDVLMRRARAAGLDRARLTPHSLRAGFVTAAAAAGATVDAIMRVTRHKRVETVYHYVRETRIFAAHAGEGVL